MSDDKENQDRQNRREELNKLANHLTRNIDLPSFIEQQASINVRWDASGIRAVCNCPMSGHNDKNASFHINKINGVWIYHCFGCKCKGTIIQFYNDFNGTLGFANAVTSLCEMLNIQYDEKIQSQEYVFDNKIMDKKRELEMENIITSDTCKKLLLSNYDKFEEWVMEAYARINKHLDEEDKDAIEKIREEAFEKMMES